MKWIRRKSNLKTQFWVAMASILFLGIASYWIKYHTLNHDSGFMRSIRWVLNPGKTRILSISTLAQDSDREYYRVVEKEGEFVVYASDNKTVRPPDPTPPGTRIWYHTASYQTGLWAPTRQFREKVLIVDRSIYPTKDGNPWPPRSETERKKQEREFAAQAALVTHAGFDPRLASARRAIDTERIWKGFVIDGFGLLAIGALVWSIAWVPVRVRDRRRVKREEGGLCPMCKYNLKATPKKCPECGWGHEREGNGDVSEGNGA